MINQLVLSSTPDIKLHSREKQAYTQPGWASRSLYCPGDCRALYRTISHMSPHTPFWLVVGNASLGVSIFFVISGFLITSLLLREHERYAAISLRNFYLRRFFRIFPGFYAYVGCIALLGGFGLISLTGSDLVSAATFTWEYSRSATSWALAHLWSLSVEEQFYILWPSTLAILLRRSGKLTAAKVTGSLIILGPLSRVVTHFYGGPFHASHIYYLLHTRLNTLMFGCLCALLEGTVALENLYRAVAKVIGFFRFSFLCYHLCCDTNSATSTSSLQVTLSKDLGLLPPCFG